MERMKTKTPGEFDNIKKHMVSCEEWADTMKNAHRFGAEKDEPEGLRYIQMSDTLARQLESFLREISEWVYDEGEYDWTRGADI